MRIDRAEEILERVEKSNAHGTLKPRIWIHQHLLFETHGPPGGIVGYGAYVPRYRLPASEVARDLDRRPRRAADQRKSRPGLDEDVITMSIEAARNAMLRAGIDPAELRAVWVGSESHPYAVKPTSTIVAEAIGAVPNVQAADWEFACKAGTEAMVAAIGSGRLGHGAITPWRSAWIPPRGSPGDALEYTAGAGGAAFILGPAEEAAGGHRSILFLCHRYARFLAAREYQKYPEHGQRFTGEPAYFKHIAEARPRC